MAVIRRLIQSLLREELMLKSHHEAKDGSWPKAELIGPQAPTELSSAMRRTADPELVGLLKVAIDPQQPLKPNQCEKRLTARSRHSSMVHKHSAIEIETHFINYSFHHL